MDANYACRVIIRAEVARDRLKKLVDNQKAIQLARRIDQLRDEARQRKVADISGMECCLIEAEEFLGDKTP